VGGDQDDVLEEIEAFLATVRGEEGPDRVLATLLCTRVVSPAATLAQRYQALMRNQLLSVTVRDLVAGSGIALREHERRTGDGWRLFSVGAPSR
jgi:hypothetical protein